VLVWPNRAQVDDAVRRWAADNAALKREVLRIGYFGSYARGDWGVGSDLDVVVVITASDTPRDRRAMTWDTTSLPVPADLLIYTEAEWHALMHANSRFGRTLAAETVWVLTR
jgi:uncharacterized protein